MKPNPLFQQSPDILLVARAQAVEHFAGNGAEGSHHMRVEMAPGVRLQDRHRCFKAHRLFAGSSRAERIEDVRHGKYACGKGDFVARQFARIPRAYSRPNWTPIPRESGQ